MKRRVRQAIAVIIFLVALDVLIDMSGYNALGLPFFSGQPEGMGIGVEEPKSDKKEILWENIEVEGRQVEDSSEPSSDEEPNVDVSKYNDFLSSGYAYKTLSGNMKEAYVQVYAALIDFKHDCDVAVLMIDDLSFVYQCVLNDHPEIFYTNGYAYTQFTRGSEVSRLNFEPSYECSKEEAEMLEGEIERVTREILNGISMDADDYTKVKYIYDYLIHSTEYDSNSPDNQNICSVLLNGRSVCQGYAKTTQFLLNRLGVETTLVGGYVHGGEGHSWNLVKMEGEYYFVDTTWGDASYTSADGSSNEWVANLDLVNYDYLGVTTDELSKTHILDNIVPVPTCTATRCNYYVKEGTIINDYNDGTLQAIFAAHPISRTQSVTIKCGSEGIFNWVIDELITNSKIFDYTGNNGGTVGYAKNLDALSITLWLDD